MPSDWGDQVMPGVYMLRGRPETSAKSQSAGGSGPGPGAQTGASYTRVYEEIAEREELVGRLRRSNQEMREYMAETHKEKNESQKKLQEEAEGMSMHGMSAQSAMSGESFKPGAEEEAQGQQDEDDAVFLEAIAENEELIKENVAALEILRMAVRSIHPCSKDFAVPAHEDGAVGSEES